MYYLCEAYRRKKESRRVYTRERACVCPFKHLPSAFESDLSLQGINICLDNFLAADKQHLARAQPFEPCVISFNQGTELQFLAGTLGFVQNILSDGCGSGRKRGCQEGEVSHPSLAAPVHLYSAEPVESLSDKAVKE